MSSCEDDQTGATLVVASPHHKDADAESQRYTEVDAELASTTLGFGPDLELNGQESTQSSSSDWENSPSASNSHSVHGFKQESTASSSELESGAEDETAGTRDIF